MGTYTPNLQFNEPTPGDPSITNSWGTILNTNAVLIDNALAGILTLSIAGSGTTILTSSAGASDQARNRLFEFTGALTGNATALWPNGLSRFFTVWNQTTGAHTLTLGANNGAGGAAGATVVIPQGATAQCFSDGTNVYGQLQNGRQLVQSVIATTSAITNFTSSTPSLYFSQSFTPQSSNSIIIINGTFNYTTKIIGGASTASAVMQLQLNRSGSLINWFAAGSNACTGVTGLNITVRGVIPIYFQESSPGTSAVTYALYCADNNASGLPNDAAGAWFEIQEYL